MATRKEVREAFYNELETAAAGHVQPSNIGQEEPNSKEDLPGIMHNDNYRSVPLNRGQAPTRVDTDTSGVIQSITFSDMMEARFTVYIFSDDETEKEFAYEAVRSHFEDYTHPIKATSSIQTDVHHVDVGDANSQDLTDADPPTRGDALTITLGYERLRTLSRGPDFSSIDDIDHLIDADNDGTTDETYNTP